MLATKFKMFCDVARIVRTKRSIVRTGRSKPAAGLVGLKPEPDPYFVRLPTGRSRPALTGLGLPGSKIETNNKKHIGYISHVYLFVDC